LPGDGIRRTARQRPRCHPARLPTPRRARGRRSRGPGAAAAPRGQLGRLRAGSSPARPGRPSSSSCSSVTCRLGSLDRYAVLASARSAAGGLAIDPGRVTHMRGQLRRHPHDLLAHGEQICSSRRDRCRQSSIAQRRCRRARKLLYASQLDGLGWKASIPPDGGSPPRTSGTAPRRPHRLRAVRAYGRPLKSQPKQAPTSCRCTTMPSVRDSPASFAGSAWCRECNAGAHRCQGAC
jgi:hypothetical protein